VLAVAVVVDFYGESDAEVEGPLVLSLEHKYARCCCNVGAVVVAVAVART
jgi:hypothetical protein